jgi:hypothetical protein
MLFLDEPLVKVRPVIRQSFGLKLGRPTARLLQSLGGLHHVYRRAARTTFVRPSSLKGSRELALVSVSPRPCTLRAASVAVPPARQ